MRSRGPVQLVGRVYSGLRDSSMISRLVVLGSCGAWPEAGRACSGFVLEHDGYRVVLDLGYGTLPRLFELTGSSVGDGIDAVIISHEHPDHMVDLHGLFRARWFGRPGAPAIPLYSPPGVPERVANLEGDDLATIGKVFAWHLLPAAPYQLGPLRLESLALPHFVPNAGVRLSSPAWTLAYTGDTGPDPALAELGRDADLFIVEASDRDQRRTAPPNTVVAKNGMRGRDAGLAASAARARRLMLTHFWPRNDREMTRAEAAAEFDGEILLAEEGSQVALD